MNWNMQVWFSVYLRWSGKTSVAPAASFLKMKESIKQPYRERDLRILEDARLLDDDFMTMVFDQNTEATELLLNIILERDDMKVLRVDTQKKEKNPVADGRSITLDIYAEDSAGKAYDIEVQRDNAGADVRRARFHSSVIDTRMLKKGQSFKELHDSYVIFITENDVMKKGLPLYHIDRIIQETDALFNDGSHIVYVNGAYKNDEDPVGRLMHDFRCTSAEDMFYEKLAKPVRYFKETKGGRTNMSSVFDDMRKEERIETTFDLIKKLMESMKWTAEQAMNAMQISNDDKAILMERF